MFYLYIAQCSDGTFYTGSTKNLSRRIKEHNQSKTGARYTRIRRPVKLVFSQAFRDRSRATKAEISVKAMTRGKKFELINGSGRVCLK